MQRVVVLQQPPEIDVIHRPIFHHICTYSTVVELKYITYVTIQYDKYSGQSSDFRADREVEAAAAPPAAAAAAAAAAFPKRIAFYFLNAQRSTVVVLLYSSTYTVLHSSFLYKTLNSAYGNSILVIEKV